VTAALPARVALPSDKWEPIHAKAPRLASTMSAYLEQISLTLRASSVEATELALREFAGYLVEHTRVVAVRGLRRGHLEAYRSWLARKPIRGGKAISPRTVRHRLGFLRNFFERLIEWEWDDAPRPGLIISADLPLVDEPLPQFLDDTAAAALLRAAATAAPLDRLLVELLARTGMRVGELCSLAADAVVRIGDSDWLRVPVGKLHNDRYVPLHPVVTELIASWRAEHSDGDYLIAPQGVPLGRHYVGRALKRVARAAGIGHVHPHQLRHTLATQSINRGMSLEAIAALLGHRDLKMTLVYARIADRKVADEYFAVTEQVEALYTSDSPVLPASAEGAAMRRLRQELERRDLGNGYCTRPAKLACAFETVCETCVHFDTGLEFVPVLMRQRNHAAERDQTHLVDIYDRLLDRAQGSDEHRQGYAGDDPNLTGSPA
jgi:site-specific recombinase XerD